MNLLGRQLDRGGSLRFRLRESGTRLLGAPRLLLQPRRDVVQLGASNGKLTLNARHMHAAALRLVEPGCQGGDLLVRRVQLGGEVGFDGIEVCLGSAESFFLLGLRGPGVGNVGFELGECGLGGGGALICRVPQLRRLFDGLFRRACASFKRGDLLLEVGAGSVE